MSQCLYMARLRESVRLCANLNLTVMAIAERAADFILRQG